MKFQMESVKYNSIHVDRLSCRMIGGSGRKSNVPVMYVVPTLPSLPYEIDRYHFYCTSDIQQIVETMEMALELFHVDFKFVYDKCKWKGSVKLHGHRIAFVIRIYKDIGDGYLVECQKRSGLTIVWDVFFRDMHQRLSHLINREARPCQQSIEQKQVSMKNIRTEHFQTKLSNNRT